MSGSSDRLLLGTQPAITFKTVLQFRQFIIDYFNVKSNKTMNDSSHSDSQDEQFLEFYKSSECSQETENPDSVTDENSTDEEEAENSSSNEESGS